MFINIYDEETRGLIRKTNGTETLYFFVLNCLRNQPDLSFSEQQISSLYPTERSLMMTTQIKTIPTAERCEELIRMLEFEDDNLNKIFSKDRVGENKKNSLFFIPEFKIWFCDMIRSHKGCTTKQVDSVKEL